MDVITSRSFRCIESSQCFEYVISVNLYLTELVGGGWQLGDSLDENVELKYELKASAICLGSKTEQPFMLTWRG